MRPTNGWLHYVWKNTKCRIFFFNFGIFNELLCFQIVDLARFARNVEWDFFFDFQTPWRGQFKVSQCPDYFHIYSEEEKCHCERTRADRFDSRETIPLRGLDWYWWRDLFRLALPHRLMIFAGRKDYDSDFAEGSTRNWPRQNRFAEVVKISSLPENPSFQLGSFSHL